MKTEILMIDGKPVRVSFSSTDFDCPNCGHSYTEEFYEKQIKERLYTYKICLSCRVKIGIAIDYKSDVNVWLKKYENRA